MRDFDNAAGIDPRCSGTSSVVLVVLPILLIVSTIADLVISTLP